MSSALTDDQKLLRKLKRRTRFTQFLVWLALLFTAAGIAAGYKNWMRIHERSKDNRAKIEVINKNIPNLARQQQVESVQNEIKTHLTKNMEHLQGAMKELRSIQDSTQHIADSVYSQVETLTLQQEKQTGTNTPIQQDWSLAEVHFLLQTAKQTLALKKDKIGAIKALNLADSILVKRGSIALLPLRKQISKDIALVSQYNVPDIESLSAKINHLQTLLTPKVQAVNKVEVPLISTTPKENTDDKRPSNESLVSRVKKSFNEAVVIHKFDKSLQDEMNEESKNSLYQLLSLRLETLRLMLLQGQENTYHQQIARIKALLNNYYSKSDYQKFEHILNELDEITISPKSPDISTSLTLLETLPTSKDKFKED